MRSTVIRGSAVLVMALFLLVSCSSGGKKANGKVKSTGTSARSATTGTNTVAAAPKPKQEPKKAPAPKVASSPQNEKDFNYNGVTKF